MDFEHGIEKGKGNREQEQEHMPAEHLDEDNATTTTMATRWNNAKAVGCQSQQTHTHAHTHTDTGHDEVFSALFLYRSKRELEAGASGGSVLHYDKMETAVAPPPLRSLFASAWLAVWSEVKLKTDQRKMPQRGNMRALPARRDSQNYYPKKKK